MVDVNAIKRSQYDRDLVTLHSTLSNFFCSHNCTKSGDVNSSTLRKFGRFQRL
jgi:hypothetical protein